MCTYMYVCMYARQPYNMPSQGEGRLKTNKNTGLLIAGSFGGGGGISHVPVFECCSHDYLEILG